MRIRTVKPELWANEKLSALPEIVHLFSAALLNYADDEGYFNANPGLIKAALFPLREPSLSIPVMLRELSKIEYLRLGEGPDGRQYGHIVMFDEHQSINKATDSKIKVLPVVWERSDRTPVVVPDNSREEQGTGNREQGGGDDAAPVALLPLVDGSDFPIRQSHVDEWTPAYPAVDIVRELHAMRVWCAAHPDRRKTRRGILRFATSWLSRQQDRGGARGAQRPQRGPDDMAGAI